MENLDVAVLRTLLEARAVGRALRPVGRHARAPARAGGGLHIGSKTPPEIAISVMAEILAAENGKDITA